MTRIVEHRCAHCSVRYAFRASGPPATRRWPVNASPSSTYCRDCWHAVEATLADIPKRCTKRFDEVTDSELLVRIYAKEQHDNEHPTRLFGKSGPIIREIGGSMMRLGPNHDVVASMHSTIVHLDGVQYLIERWSDDSHPVKVLGAVEVNLISGVCCPWKDL